MSDEAETFSEKDFQGEAPMSEVKKEKKSGSGSGRKHLNVYLEAEEHALLREKLGVYGYHTQFQTCLVKIGIAWLSGCPSIEEFGEMFHGDLSNFSIVYKKKEKTDATD